MKPVIGISSRLLMKDRKFFTNETYIKAVEAAGGIPLQLPILTEDTAGRLASVIDGLIVPGGSDVAPLSYGEEPVPAVGGTCRRNDRVEYALIREMERQHKPVFGICRGIQVINTCYGGTLIQDIPSQTGSRLAHHQDQNSRGEMTHTVEVRAGTHLADIVGAGRLEVNSYHHQSVGRLAEGFAVTAVAPDGIVEGIENEDGSILAIQWHPESLHELDEHHAALFRAFVDRCCRAHREAALPLTE